MSIRNRLYLSAGISVVLVAALLSVVIVTSGRIAEESRRHQLLTDVHNSVSELNIVALDYLLHREERMEHQWSMRYDSLEEILDGLVEEEGLSSMRADYEALGGLFSQVTGNYRERLGLIQEGASQEQIDTSVALEERLVAQLLVASHSMITDASRLSEEAHTRQLEAQRRTSNWTVTLMAILAAAITASSLALARSISKPLTRLADYSKRVGEGEYTADIEIAGKDEVASVASDVKSMVGQLQKHREHLEEEITERREAQHDLGERVKELECLYRIATVTQKPDVIQDEAFQEVANLVPPGWHYPDITCARVIVDGKEFVTPGFEETVWRQASDIVLDDQPVGVVEVYYLEEKPELDEGPFLKEERNLIDGIAGQLAGFVERRRAEELREHLSAMLRAIRNVNQLIVKEKDPERLLKRVCENFVRTRGCDIAWIVLLDSSGNVTKVAEAAVDGVLPIIPRLEEGTLPNCAQRAVRQSTVITTGVSSSRCKGCSLVESCLDRGVMTVRLEHDGKVCGLLSAALPARFLSEPQERSLFKEVAGDICFALHGMELEEERERAEEALRRSAEEWQETFDSISDAVSVHDTDFRIVRVNQACVDLLGKKPEEIVGKHCYEVFHGTDEPLPTCPFHKTIQTKESAGLEVFEPYLGIHLEAFTSPVFDERGEVVACVHVARDVSERKKMEEQLIVTDRLATIGELASGIAHELNNPLTSVIGFSELVMDTEVPEEAREHLEIINREAKRTSGIVRNLLTFARKQAPTKEPVDIHSVLQMILDLRAYEEKVSNIEVSTHLAPDLPEIMADGSQLQQVFLNVILNAEQAMLGASGRGALTVTTERSGDAVRISFADDGPGISPENLEHIFDPFFTTKELGKGTGLGLSICYGIVSEHGGKIYGESEVGKGTTFTVELPIGG